jgi:pimeloyl-ACP methyl ester carboxylesterase
MATGGLGTTARGLQRPSGGGGQHAPLRPPRAGLLRRGNHLLGHFEALDASAAVTYALSRAPDIPVDLIGYSMGGAVALMYAARDGRVGSVAADSTFASERRLVRALLRKRVGPLSGPVAALSERLLPYDPGEVELLKEVVKISPCATLLIHGLRDRTRDPKDWLRL